VNDLKEKLQKINKDIDAQRKRKATKLRNELKNQNIRKAQRYIRNIEETVILYAQEGRTSAPIYTFEINKNHVAEPSEECLPAVEMVKSAIIKKGLNWSYDRAWQGEQTIYAVWRDE